MLRLKALVPLSITISECMYQPVLCDTARNAHSSTGVIVFSSTLPISLPIVWLHVLVCALVVFRGSVFCELNQSVSLMIDLSIFTMRASAAGDK